MMGYRGGSYWGTVVEVGVEKVVLANQTTRQISLLDG